MNKSMIGILWVTGLVSVFSGCGREIGEVKVKSGTLTAQAAGAGEALAAGPSGASGERFEICVRRVRLEDDEGQSRADDDDKKDGRADDDGYFELSPGLVDLTEGDSRDWGAFQAPVGFRLARIKVKLQKHEQLCKTGYSLRFGSLETNRDVEFRFVFNPPVELKSGATVKLAMGRVIEAVRAAAQNGDLNKIRDYLEPIEDEAIVE